MSEKAQSKDIGNRLATVMNGMGQGQFAELLGVNVKTVGRWLSGETIPDGASLLALAQRFDVDPMWLLTGKGVGPAHAGAPVASDTCAETKGWTADRKVQRLTVEEPMARYVYVPLLDVQPAAGSDVGTRGGGERLGTFAFERSYVTEHWGAVTSLVAVRVRGDSMEPTLAEGEEIVVDRTKTHVDVSGLYVFSLGGDLLVKRVQRRLDGSLLVRSDNPAYETEVVGPEAQADFEVLGRVVWPRLR